MNLMPELLAFVLPFRGRSLSLVPAGVFAVMNECDVNERICDRVSYM